MFRVDPLTSLGLNSDSILSYRMGEVERSHVSELPELLPCGYLVGENNIINITLKGENFIRIKLNEPLRFYSFIKSI